MNQSRIPNPVFQNGHKEPTPEQLADQFAAQAVKTVLAPAPDGFDILAQLAPKASKPTG